MVNKIVKILVSLAAIAFPAVAFASSMNSNSFIITSDDLSAGGGYSNSNSFASQGDIGGTAAGTGLTSASFKACAGYPCTLTSEDQYLSFSVSPNSVDFGMLNASAVTSGETTITTATNIGTGYITTCHTDGDLRTAGSAYISGVADGTVSAGANEYGVTLTGIDRAFADAEAISTSSKVVASSGSASNSSTVVSFEAGMSTTNLVGNYSQVVTFITTVSF